MPKAFLSHSSAQKLFVEEVATQLKDDCLIDSKSFEEGLESLDEILNALGRTDLFVLFISEEALESEWVRKEIVTAKRLLEDQKLQLIYPLIIDSRVHWDDPRIPTWLSTRNLRHVLRSGKATRLIRTRLQELAWEKHPVLKKRDEIYVGRTAEMASIEQRFDDYAKAKPVVLNVSGMIGIGRRRFMLEALRKASVLSRPSYKFPSFSLDDLQSIEDFIVNVYGLGLSEELDLALISGLEYSAKVDLAVRLLRDIREMGEYLLVLDGGCIIRHDRTITPWFHDVMSRLEAMPQTQRLSICLVSKFNPLRIVSIQNDWFYNINLHGLTATETSGLMSRCFGLYGIDCDVDDFNSLMQSIRDFPGQVFFAVELIENIGVAAALKNIDAVRNYKREMFAMLMEDIKQDEPVADIVSILVEFGIISLSLLYETAKGHSQETVDDVISKLDGRSLVEFIGTNQENIQLTDSLRSFLLRQNFRIKSKYKTRLREHIITFIKSDQYKNDDITDFFYSLKAALQSDYKFQSKLLIPSIYLKSMRTLYEDSARFTDVVAVGRRVLAESHNMDVNIVREIHYWICLALARLKDEAFLTEVRFFDKADYHFLLGFYYRNIGKPEYALENYYKAIFYRPDFMKAQREIVIVLQLLGLYDEALAQAKYNYERMDEPNPHHVLAYFDCLARSKDAKSRASEMERLIDELKKINTRKSAEMAGIAEADYTSIVRSNPSEALRLLDSAKPSGGRIGALMLERKFGIYEKIPNIDGMSATAEEYKSVMSSENVAEKNSLTIMRAKLLAHGGSLDPAVQLIRSELRFYTEAARERLIEHLTKVSRGVKI